jgi:hypothetical protein
MAFPSDERLHCASHSAKPKPALPLLRPHGSLRAAQVAQFGVARAWGALEPLLAARLHDFAALDRRDAAVLSDAMLTCLLEARAQLPCASSRRRGADADANGTAAGEKKDDAAEEDEGATSLDVRAPSAAPCGAASARSAAVVDRTAGVVCAGVASRAASDVPAEQRRLRCAGGADQVEHSRSDA